MQRAADKSAQNIAGLPEARRGIRRSAGQHPGEEIAFADFEHQAARDDAFQRRAESAGFPQLLQPLVAFGSFLQMAQFREFIIGPTGEVFPARAFRSPVAPGAERARRVPAGPVPVMSAMAARNAANLFGRLCRRAPSLSGLGLRGILLIG